MFCGTSLHLISLTFYTHKLEVYPLLVLTLWVDELLLLVQGAKNEVRAIGNERGWYVLRGLGF